MKIQIQCECRAKLAVNAVHAGRRGICSYCKQKVDIPPALDKTLMNWNVFGFLLACGLIVFCTGCPPRPPSQEEQRQAVISRWFTVESAEADKLSPLLSDDDIDAITAQVPLLTRIVPERVANLRISFDDTEQDNARICGTNAEYLEVLRNRTRADLIEGRFFDSNVRDKNENVVVLSDSLAQKLFGDAKPVGASVTIAEQELTVAGLIGPGIGRDVPDVVHDAYLPLETLRRIHPETDSRQVLDRIRCKVETLEQVKPTMEVIENVLKKRLDEQDFRVR